MTWRRLAVIAALSSALLACTDDAEPTTTSTTLTTTTTTAPSPADDLSSRLVTAAELPPGFAPVDDVDDTITTFCAGQDAAAGLQATGRAIVGFARTPAGASVIHLVLRFEGDGAEQFVTQAEDLLTTCSDVPDASGLAFTYEPASEHVAAAVEDTDARASRYGVSVGSGNLTINIAVFRAGEEAHVVAVLGLEEPREALDELASDAYAAAVSRSR